MKHIAFLTGAGISADSVLSAAKTDFCDKRITRVRVPSMHGR